MTAPDSDIHGPLHPLFPIDITDSPGTYESEFWKLRNLRPDRNCIDSLVLRARSDPRWRRRFTAAPQPRWVPETAHEETAEDMGLPAGWWRDDTFPREGMPQPASTETFIKVSQQAEAHERKAAERRAVRRVRRFVVRLVRGT
jgi:hypothetical protein